MKKILLAVVALCAIAAFALPPIIASQTEQVLASSLNQNEAMRQYLEVKVSDYQKGYRQSSARLDFSLGPMYRTIIEGQIANADDDADASMNATDAQELRDILQKVFSMDVDIEHGPVLLSNGVGVGVNRYRATLSDTETIRQFEQMLGVEDFLEIVSHTTLTGTTKMDLTLKPFELEEDGETLKFSGMRSDGSWSQGNRHLLAKGEAASLAITSSEGNVTVDNIAFDIDNYVEEKGFIATGTTAFSLDSMTIDGDDASAESVKLAGLSFGTNVVRPNGGDTLDIEAVYRLDSAAGNREPTARDMSLAFAMRNIRTEVFVQYQKLMMNAADFDEEQMEALQDLLYTALTASPTVEIGPIEATIDGESFSSNLEVKVDGAKLPPAAEFFFADPAVWMTIAAADAKINASEKLVNMAVDSYMRDQILATVPPDVELSDDELDSLVVEQRPMLTDQVIKRGFVTLENGEYSTVATFVDGELTVNGTPFPLDALMGGGP